MSASKEWTEWHLTQTGWVRGSHRVDYQGTTMVEKPADRVLTCKYEEILSSSFSSLDKEVTVTWQSDDKENISRLLEKFGDCPKHV